MQRFVIEIDCEEKFQKEYLIRLVEKKQEIFDSSFNTKIAIFVVNGSEQNLN